MHAEKCPVCEGRGVLPDATDVRCYKDCHGCGGKGWVEVHNAIERAAFVPGADPYVDPSYQWTTFTPPDEYTTTCVSDVLAPRVDALRALATQ